jgi:hypothetical protein
MKICEVVQKFKPGDTQIVITLLSPPVTNSCKLKTLSEGCNVQVPARSLLGHTALIKAFK